MLTPFRRRGFMDLEGEINRLFDEMWGGPLRRESVEQAPWVPATDVKSHDGDLVLRMELPGIKKDDVDISLANGVLTVSGERKEEKEDEREGYHSREIRYGSFRRSMRLPEGTDSSKVHAKFEDGVLEVTVEGAAIERGAERIQIEG